MKVLENLALLGPSAIRKGAAVVKAPIEESQELNQYVESHYKFNRISFNDSRNPNSTRRNVKATPKLYIQPKQSTAVSYIQFLTIIFSLHGSLHDNVKFISLCAIYGSWRVLLVFCILIIMVAMPISMVFFFLSNYTKTSYIRFFQSVPVLKGLSISIVILNFISCLFNNSITGLALIYLISSVAYPSWMNCNFPWIEPNAIKDCIKLANKGPFCQSPNDTMPSFSTYLLMKDMITKGMSSGGTSYWILMIIILWIILILFLIFSQELLIFLCKCSAVVWFAVMTPIALYGMIFGTRVKYVSAISGPRSAFLDATFWVLVGRASLRRVLPGDLVTYASLTISGHQPTTMAVLMTSLKIVFVCTITNIITIAIFGFLETHEVVNLSCMDIDGLSVLFAIVPDFLSLSPASFLLMPLYFGFLVFIGTMATFFSINSFLEAITDESQDCREYRKVVIIFAGLISCIMNIVIILNGFETLMDAEGDMVMAPLVTFLGVALYVLSYKPIRIFNDYHFAFGQVLGTFWKSALTTYVIFVVLIFWMYMIFVVFPVSLWICVINIFAMLLLGMPMVTISLAQITIAKRNNVNWMLPDENWGSPNRAERLSRKSFNPRYISRIDLNVACLHECLLRSPELKRFIDEVTIRNEFFFFKYQDHLKTIKFPASGDNVIK